MNTDNTLLLVVLLIAGLIAWRMFGAKTTAAAPTTGTTSGTTGTSSNSSGSTPWYQPLINTGAKLVDSIGNAIIYGNQGGSYSTVGGNSSGSYTSGGTNYGSMPPSMY